MILYPKFDLIEPWPNYDQNVNAPWPKCRSFCHHVTLEMNHVHANEKSVSPFLRQVENKWKIHRSNFRLESRNDCLLRVIIPRIKWKSLLVTIVTAKIKTSYICYTPWPISVISSYFVPFKALYRVSPFIVR